MELGNTLRRAQTFCIRDLRRALPDLTWECVRPTFGAVAYEGRTDGMLVVVTLRRRHELAIYTRRREGEKLESLFGLSDDGLLLRRSVEVYGVDEIAEHVSEASWRRAEGAAG